MSPRGQLSFQKKRGKLKDGKPFLTETEERKEESAAAKDAAAA